ncbi:hypothetical protein [Sorangium sp. So ce542]|uniref:hypothetical protein n=1 Tax=Sorangium sp. So ce542 TaxID=3133316 RepID=UPI003F5DC08C
MVTIVNSSNDVLHLNGWKLLDNLDREEPLSGSIHPAHALTIVPKGDGARLGNNGGTITLLDPCGLKVDGVPYTKRDARRRGRPILFSKAGRGFAADPRRQLHRDSLSSHVLLEGLNCDRHRRLESWAKSASCRVAAG